MSQTINAEHDDNLGYQHSDAVTEAQSTQALMIIINLNAKLRPDDQGELEDAFLAYCQESDLPIEILGGGSLVDDNGESMESIIEMSFTEVE